MVWTGGDSSSSSASPPTTSPSQTAESPTTQRKKKITRTRTGCQTCRDRKVKCGEERPECINCQRTNHVCPGYAPATVYRSTRKRSSQSSSTAEPSGTFNRWRIDKVAPTMTIVTTATSRMESTLSWTPAPNDSFEDLRLLHYYTHDLAHTLSLPGAIGRTWSDGVPELAFGGNHEYLVHALLAFSAAHKVSKDPNDTKSKERGQLHYGQSLAVLQKLDLKSDESHASAALAAVMLLTWYESLNESLDNGLMVHYPQTYLTKAYSRSGLHRSRTSYRSPQNSHRPPTIPSLHTSRTVRFSTYAYKSSIYDSR